MGRAHNRVCVPYTYDNQTSHKTAYNVMTSIADINLGYMSKFRFLFNLFLIQLNFVNVQNHEIYFSNKLKYVATRETFLLTSLFGDCWITSSARQGRDTANLIDEIKQLKSRSTGGRATGPPRSWKTGGWSVPLRLLSLLWLAWFSVFCSLRFMRFQAIS